MPDIVAFLTARYEELEAIALEARKGPDGVDFPDDPDNGHWTAYGHPPSAADRRQDRPVELVGTEVQGTLNGWTICEVGQQDRAKMISAHIARHDPAHVLADLASKRAILTDYQLIVANNAIDDAVKPDELRAAARNVIIKTLRMVLLHHAAPFSAHPDYKPERWINA
jgi:Family of unknown function (DUF6221)